MSKSADIEETISNALKEDLRDGDITTEAVLIDSTNASAKILIKEDGIIAGLNILKMVFTKVDAETSIEFKLTDGSKVNIGNVAATVTGSAASILKAERTALNFLQRMSGIATLTNLFVNEIGHTKAKILDTRKTVPGLRMFDKEAVKIGGGTNHRIGLFDMFLIKDNHIEAAGSISKAVEACKKYKKLNKNESKIEVETKNISEVVEALKSKADIIMLDNFNIELMKEAVELIGDSSLIEASGNVNLKTVKSIAETGVDFISVGALTHSVKALDISLELNLKK